MTDDGRPQREDVVPRTEYTRHVRRLGSDAMRPSWQISQIVAHPDAAGMTPLMKCAKKNHCYHAWRSRDGSVALVNTRVNGGEIWRLAKKKSTARVAMEWGRADLSPDGATTLCVIGDSTVRLCDTKRGVTLREHRFEEGEQVQSVRYVSPGVALVGLPRGVVVRWDLTTWAPTWTRQFDLVPLVDVTVTPDGTLAAARNQDMTVVFRTADGEVVARVNRASHSPMAPYNTLALAPDGSWLAFLAKDTQVQVVDLPSCHERPLGAGHCTSIASMAWLDEGCRLASAAMDDPQLRVWGIATGETDWMLEVERDVSVMAMEPTPDGRSLVTGWSRGGLHVLDLQGAEVRTQTKPDSVDRVYVSRDGEWVLYGYRHSDAGVHAWRMADRWPRWRTTASFQGTFAAAAWSPDGDAVFVFTGDALRVHDTRTGEERRRQALPRNHVFGDAALLADGRTALVAVHYYDREMHAGWRELWLWDTEGGGTRWRQRDDFVENLAVSSDERWFVHSRYDAVLFRSMENGRQLDAISLDGADSARCLALAPGDRRLAIGTYRGFVLIYDIDTEGLSRHRP